MVTQTKGNHERLLQTRSFTARSGKKIEVRPIADEMDALVAASIQFTVWRNFVAIQSGLPPKVVQSRGPRWHSALWERYLAAQQAESALSGVAFLGSIDGSPSGVIWAGQCKRVGYDEPPTTGEIASYYVLGKAQSEGLGNALIHVGEKTLHLMGYTEAVLYSPEPSHALIAHYINCGWTPMSDKVELYVGNGIDNDCERLDLVGALKRMGHPLDDQAAKVNVVRFTKPIHEIAPHPSLPVGVPNEVGIDHDGRYAEKLFIAQTPSVSEH